MTTMTSLGDIMNTGQEHDDPSSTLASKYGITNPLDRLLLTANGNLQRLVASYYDAPVTVVVQSCTPRRSLTVVAQPTTTIVAAAAACPPQIWDRCVQLQVLGRTFVTAQSVIVVHDPVCQQLVQSGTVGLGQLFRHLNLLPEFELHAACSCSNNNDNSGGGGRLQWREYTLRCRELTCRIVETFEPNVWDVERLSES